MSFGLDMGTAIYARIAGRSQSSIDDDTICGPDHGLGPDYYALFFLMASLSFNVLIEAHWRQLLPMTVISAVATFVNIYTDKPLGSSASCVVSALACGISANIYSRLTGNPAIIGVLSGLLMLVPGSVAVRGFGLLFQNDISGGIGLAITVVVRLNPLSFSHVSYPFVGCVLGFGSWNLCRVFTCSSRRFETLSATTNQFTGRRIIENSSL